MGVSRSFVGQTPFGLLGRTLGHSWSPRIHTTFGSAPYGLFEREPDELCDFVRNGSWRGINVTIPYKRDVIALADELSERVRRIGAANTLVRQEDGSIFAENTDVLGFNWMLERFAQRANGTSAREAYEGRKVLVLGTGGASAAVCDVLGSLDANAVVISRTGNETYRTLVDRHADATLLVNTTPVGMFPHCPAAPVTEQTLQQLDNLTGIVDVVYNPERTGLCLAADKMGIPSESGLGMLVSQAFFASELFQGTTLDEGLVIAVEDELRRAMRNVILIGMPSCGKTGAGRRLARMASRPFVDLDDSFLVDHGMTPSECILTYGEETFRTLETETAATYGARSGLVIACGGGVVTRPRNYDILHQNGTIVFLDRPLEELTSVDRPLSQSKGIERIAQERMGLYRAWADIVLPCTGSAMGDALAIRDLLRL